MSTFRVAEHAEEPADHVRLLEEQAAVIVQYKKMYDRSSALAKIGVWECDLATEELTWTDGVYDLFELPRGSTIQRARIVDLYFDESRREMERLRAQAIREAGSFSLDIHVRTAKGNDRWIRLTADVEQEDGKPIRIFGTKQDISEEKWAQEKLQRLQTELIHVSRKSAMGVMAATLAHEINQPLAAISSYAAGARRALGSAAIDAETLDITLRAIERNAIRAGKIIRSLRAVTHESTTGHQTIDPNPLIREAGAIAAARNQTIVIRYGLADDVRIVIDPVQFQQVIINLLQNAAEAVRDRPDQEISVASTVQGASVDIRVEDNGDGIGEEMLDAVFDSFTSSKTDGMGLGLPISRTIVEAHGGKISAENRKGGGACVCISLPAFRED